jgi:polar amino acid transport system ATP-binding protein
MMGPVKVLGKSKSEAADLAEVNLKKVGLWEKASADPTTLSGGQQQRVGIARALAMSPDIVLFDEATSALDPGASKEVFEVIDRLAFQEGTTMVLVTHDMQFAFGEVPDEVIFMKDGIIQRRGKPLEVRDDPLVRQFSGWGGAG